MARERLTWVSRRNLLLGAGALTLLAACGEETAPAPPAATAAATAPPAPTEAPAGSAADSAPDAVDSGGAVRVQVELVPLGEDELEAAEDWTGDGWLTDFSIKSVHLSEITQAALKRDIIPPIDEPMFIPASQLADLPGNEPVAVLQVGDQVKAYPLRILTYHEIVNDELAGVPVAATFCPLCNTAIGFRRQVQGQTLRMGVSANLRVSNLLMWDDVSESWWQQSTGEAVVGSYTGWRLQFLPMAVSSFATFSESFPEAPVLSEETGYGRRYGRNPYVGYDSGTRKPFLFFEDLDERLPATERVIVVTIASENVAYPFSTLSRLRVVHDRVGGESIVVLFAPGTASALGAETIAEGRDVGAAGVFTPRLDEQDLTFSVEGDQIVDDATNSTWNSLGIATSGQFRGRALPPVVHGNDFWFSWASLREQVRIFEA